MFNNLLKFFNYIPLIKQIPLGNASLRIVYYHKINTIDSEYYFDNDMNLSVFKLQIEYLNKHFNIISLSEAIERGKNGDTLKGYLVITFDDGFSDCYNLAYPILKKYGVKATFFLITDTIDNKDLMWRNKLLYCDKKTTEKDRRIVLKLIREEFNVPIDIKYSYLRNSNNWIMSQKDNISSFIWENSMKITLNEFLQENEPYLTSIQIKELISNGFEIGSHTKSHPFCDKLNWSEVESEIINSTKSLEKEFSIIINSFSYPFGNRVSETFENEILRTTNIDTLLGIYDLFSNNHNNIQSWERTGLEKEFNKSLIALLWKPYYRRLKK